MLLQSSTGITNWEDRLQYEPFCKAYFQELEPRHDIFRYYTKLIQASQFSDLFNIKWFPYIPHICLIGTLPIRLHKLIPPV